MAYFDYVMFFPAVVCTFGQKKWDTLIYFKTNYRTKMKIPIIMDYCLLQFDALNFFLGVRLYGVSQPNSNFFYVKH